MLRIPGDSGGIREFFHVGENPENIEILAKKTLLYFSGFFLDFFWLNRPEFRGILAEFAPNSAFFRFLPGNSGFFLDLFRIFKKIFRFFYNSLFNGHIIYQTIRLIELITNLTFIFLHDLILSIIDLKINVLTWFFYSHIRRKATRFIALQSNDYNYIRVDYRIISRSYFVSLSESFMALVRHSSSWCAVLNSTFLSHSVISGKAVPILRDR